MLYVAVTTCKTDPAGKLARANCPVIVGLVIVGLVKTLLVKVCVSVVPTPEPATLTVPPAGHTTPLEPLIVTAIYATTQVEPEDTVTVMPEFTVTGPAERPFWPAAIV